MAAPAISEAAYPFGISGFALSPGSATCPSPTHQRGRSLDMPAMIMLTITPTWARPP